jgi:hypothetical protein
MQHTEEVFTTQEMYVQYNIEARSCTHCCSEKAVSITYYGSVLINLRIQHAMRMRHIVICGLFWLSSVYIKCVFRVCLQILSHTFLTLRSTERDMTKYVYCPSWKAPVILVRFQLNMNFFDRFSKYNQI